MDNKEIIENITERVRPYGTWCSPVKTERLFNLVHEIGDGCKAIEIGVFRGQSAFVMALAMQSLGHTESKLTTVDPWSTEACLEGSNDSSNDEWWASLDMDAIYAEFSAGRASMQLNEFIDVIRGKSEEAANKLKQEEFDIIHIDGNHSEEKSLQDVDLWLPRLKNDGYLIMDDVNWDHTVKAQKILKDYLLEVGVFEPEYGSHFAIYKNV